MIVWKCCLPLWLACGLACAAASEEALIRRALPLPEKLREAESALRDSYKDDLKKFKPSEQLALAGKLIEQSQAPAVDPAMRYQLLCLSAELAVKQKSDWLVCRALDLLGNGFLAEAAPMKIKALDQILRSAREAGTCRVLASTYLALADDAAEIEDYTAALAAAASAQAAARTAKETALAADAAKKTEALRAMQRAFASIESARARLFENPGDPDASLAVGKYCCLNCRNWPKGLPLLARSGDAKWAAAAKEELDNPKTAAGQFVLAGMWHALSEGLPKSEQDSLRLHAAEWYDRAQPELDETGRIMAEKRIREALSFGAPSPADLDASDVTRRAVPSAEEWLRLQALCLTAVGDNDRKPLNRFQSILIKRLTENPERWSDDDYLARLDAERKIERIMREAQQPFARGIFGVTWSQYAAAAPTREIFARRLRKYFDPKNQDAAGDHSLAAQTSALSCAVMSFSMKNNYWSRVSQIHFCDWLKESGVNPQVIDEHKKMLNELDVQSYRQSDGYLRN